MRAVLVMGALCLAGCAAPSTRIAAELGRYGLAPQQAQCVGNRLESSLSLRQLQQLGRAAHAYAANNPTPDRLAVGDLVRASGQITDLKIPIEVAKAAAGCGVV